MKIIYTNESNATGWNSHGVTIKCDFRIFQHLVSMVEHCSVDDPLDDEIRECFCAAVDDFQMAVDGSRYNEQKRIDESTES